MRERFEAEIWPLAEKVLRVAQLLVRNRADAEELAQETLLRAFRSLQRFDGRNPQAWLLTILRNVRTDRLRSRRVTAATNELDGVAAPEPAEEAPWSDPAAMLEQFSDQKVIEALQALPEDIRWTLLLVDVEELDGATAAQVMSVPEGTVKSRLHRGRAMLRKSLAES